LVYWKVLSGKHSSGTGDEASGAEAYLYVISCGLERAKIGVAGYASRIDPRLSSMSSFRQKATMSAPTNVLQETVAQARAAVT